MQDGKRVGVAPSLKEIQQYAAESLRGFHKTYKRQINPHIYKVSLSHDLKKLKMSLLIATRRRK
jgi:nicotinate phosphoribosyltransferase